MSLVVEQSGEAGHVPPSSDLAALYRRIWRNTAYRKFAPGERNLDAMLDALRPARGASFIDFGCGTGRPAHELTRRGFAVLGVDFADNCLDNGVDVPFLVADLAKLPELSAQYGYCTDVLEHVETEHVDDVLAGISRIVRNAVFFSISTVADHFGPLLAAKQLHVTIRNAEWWRESLARYWPRVEIVAKSGIELFVVCRKLPAGFVESVEGAIDTACNTSELQILANVRINAARSIPSLKCCHAHERHAVLVGGGPSLWESLHEIALRRDDADVPQEIFALNGAAKFLLARGIIPDYLVMIDPREDNVKFLEEFPARRFLIASQCHPRIFDTLIAAGRDVMMFHMHMDNIKDALPKNDVFSLVTGSISVGLSAMSVAMGAGYRMLHLYGYDSSDNAHERAPEYVSHAYAQDETAAESKRLTALHNGKSYSCSYAMFQQAELFPAFASMLTEAGATITVHGTGLLPDIAREMAAT